jgi:histidinol-phosphate aminotransferase
LEQKGIMVRPVGNFGAPGRVRISFGTREANIAMLKALETIVKLGKVTT